jgi:predicted nucleotide-binding protein
MESSVNPFNCSRPGNLFVGYSDLRQRMLRGLENGKSYAVLGGRRCGKTSFLMKMEEDMKQGYSRHLHPCMLDMQAVVPRSPADFFRAVYNLTVAGTESPPWSGTNYQDFLASLDRVRAQVEQRDGPDWVKVLLVDELDSGAAKLPDSECLQNLRNLLMNSRFSRNFRVVATGVSSLSELITDRSSPLNNLDPEYLGVLGREEARSLVIVGFPEGLPARMETLLFGHTGRHPYILQGMLEYLWDSGREVDERMLQTAGQRFVRDRAGTFRRWIQDFRAEGCAVFQALTESPLSARELRGRIAKNLSVDEGLRTLGYHGVIDETDLNAPSVSSTLFRDWFTDNYHPETNLNTGTLEAEKKHTVAEKHTRVFVVHGRNERVRVALFGFLRSLGLEPLEWTALVEATQNPAPHIAEILSSGFKIAHAAIVLLTPDDEARLREDFRKASDPDYESELLPQPRPNVLFEAGMAMAHFPNRTVLVRVGRCRPFSDVAGIHFVEMDNSIEKRKDLAKRLRMAGCAIIDLESSTGWQTEGNFSAAEPVRSVRTFS